MKSCLTVNKKYWMKNGKNVHVFCALYVCKNVMYVHVSVHTHEVENTIFTYILAPCCQNYSKLCWKVYLCNCFSAPKPLKLWNSSVLLLLQPQQQVRGMDQFDSLHGGDMLQTLFIDIWHLLFAAACRSRTSSYSCSFTVDQTDGCLASAMRKYASQRLRDRTLPGTAAPCPASASPWWWHSIASV